MAADCLQQDGEIHSTKCGFGLVKTTELGETAYRTASGESFCAIAGMIPWIFYWMNNRGIHLRCALPKSHCELYWRWQERWDMTDGSSEGMEIGITTWQNSILNMVVIRSIRIAPGWFSLVNVLNALLHQRTQSMLCFDERWIQRSYRTPSWRTWGEVIRNGGE